MTAPPGSPARARARADRRAFVSSKPGTVVGHTAVLGRSITDKPGDEPKQTNA
nr:hypothetical protein KPHV_33520 [Kitasatospora purpeofusca]